MSFVRIKIKSLNVHHVVTINGALPKARFKRRATAVPD